MNVYPFMLDDNLSFFPEANGVCFIIAGRITTKICVRVRVCACVRVRVCVCVCVCVCVLFR